MSKPVVLTIIDGLGLAPKQKGNAWSQARTPTLDHLWKNYPHSKIKAAGQAVGLPEGQIGNSEVGHLNIGAGQIVYTGLSLIEKALIDKSFFTNKAFLKSIKHAKKHNSTVHVMGLLSPGGVHSLDEHAFEILKMLKEHDIKKVTFHVFTDGRDVAPRSVKPFLAKLMTKLTKYNYQLGSIAGRLYAMDRDQMFNKTEQAFAALYGKSTNTFTDPLAYIDKQYEEKKLNDEFIECAINSDTKVNFLATNDSVIFFNFRPDRARQLAHLLVGSNLYQVKPSKTFANLQMTIMMPYDGINNVDVAFAPMEVKTPLGLVLANHKIKQLRIAETQKYAHVTFFLDGGKDITYPFSERILIDSAKIDNFAHKPEMSASKITDALIKALPNFDVIVVNYANPDMVGHTGDLTATIKAVEVIDQEIAKLQEAVTKLGGTMFITADHGNAEIMLDNNNKVVTKHTTSDVPLICTDLKITLKDGILANLAPTILGYLNLPIGKAMEVKSLIV